MRKRLVQDYKQHKSNGQGSGKHDTPRMIQIWDAIKGTTDVTQKSPSEREPLLPRKQKFTIQTRIRKMCKNAILVYCMISDFEVKRNCFIQTIPNQELKLE